MTTRPVGEAFDEIVLDRLLRDPAFGRALLEEAHQAVKAGDLTAARALVLDLVKTQSYQHLKSGGISIESEDAGHELVERVIERLQTYGARELIDALQNSPHREIEIEPERAPMPVRDVPPLDQQTDARVDDILEIGRRCASTMETEKPTDHATLLFDERGIPK